MKAAAALLLALGGLSGCLDGDGAQAWAPPAVDARYRFFPEPGSPTGPSDLAVSVQEAGERRDRDDHYRDAYRQTYAAVGSGGDTRAIHALLDRHLRVVRTDQDCFVSDESGCLPETLVSWEPRFRASLMGYGWPQSIARDGRLATGYEDTAFAPEAAVSKEGGRTVVTFSSPDGPSMRHLYDGGEWMPSRIESSEGWAMERTEYREGAPLAPIAPWPDQAPLPVVPSQEPLPIPDADRDLLGAGMSPRQAYDAILDASAEARATMDGGGCVARYAVEVPDPDEPSPLLPPLEERVSSHILVLADADGRLRSWTLTLTRDLAGMTRQTVEAEEDPQGDDGACLAGPAARTATTPVGSVLARLAQFGAATWWQATVRQPIHGSRSPDHGWVTYRFGARGDGDLGLRDASFDASQGVWLHIEGHGPGFGVDQNR